MIRRPIVPVILCGGSGTRLLPLSRTSRPKQFIDLIADRSTFQMAVERAVGPAFDRPIVVAPADLRFIVAEQLAQVGVEADLLLEPVRRDSGPAVAAATLHAEQRRPGTTVLGVPADHLVDDPASFSAACAAALPLAEAGLIMTIGMRPAEPATAYGYIEPGDAVSGTEAFRVSRFVEKPDLPTAARLVSDGWLWNSGNFLFRADVMIQELGRHAPALLRAARQAHERAAVDRDFVRLDDAAFRQAPSISIDHAVMELTDRAGVLPAVFGWSDIGTWRALRDASARDQHGNVTRGDVATVEVRNSYVWSEGLLTVVVGLEEVVVVTTRDAVLVASIECSDPLKRMVADLAAKGRCEVNEQPRAARQAGEAEVDPDRRQGG